MHRSRRVLLVATVFITAALGFLALVLRLALRAMSIQNEMREFRPGPFSVERLKKWADGHGGSMNCDGGECWADTRVTNWPLYVLKIARPTAFDAAIETTDGSLTQTSLQLISDPRDGSTRASTLLIVHFSGRTIESKTGIHGTHVGHEPIGKSLSVVYSVDQTAASDEIALARTANIWCLVRVGGCTGHQQSPKVWALRRHS